MLNHWKYRNPKILRHAKGQECQMKLPGVCNGNPETVVAAHSNSFDDGKGMGTKSHDLFVAYLCDSCHSAYDGQRKVPWMDRYHIEEAFYRAMRKTLLILVRDGVLK